MQSYPMEQLMIRGLFSIYALFVAALILSLSMQPRRVSAGTNGAIFTSADSAVAGFQTIHNDFYWVDDKGARIQTRSGCLRQFNGKFYWYGGTNGFRDQTCYTSTDMVHWRF